MAAICQHVSRDLAGTTINDPPVNAAEFVLAMIEGTVLNAHQISQALERAAEHASPTQPCEPPSLPVPDGGQSSMHTGRAVERGSPALHREVAAVNLGQDSGSNDAVAVAVDEAPAFEVAGSSTATPTTQLGHPRPPTLPSEPTPTPQEASRRLQMFTRKVQRKRPLPIIKVPPKQKEFVRKPPVLLRSRRIAAQQLDNIPTSKKGEVLLMRRLGVLPSNAAPSSATRRSFDTLFTELATNDGEAFDELFADTRRRGARLARRPLAIQA